MKLTDELYERGKSQKSICSVIDDDYVLLHKKMPCSDQDLDKYIKSILDAKKEGIKMSGVTDYRLIPGTTHTFGSISYTSGVFIEERAKGISCPENPCTYLSAKKEYDYDAVANDYLTSLTQYIEMLEYKNSSPQGTYDKLVSDITSIINYGICIDPKPTNFFYDKKEGYTIIDPIPINKYANDMEYYPHYVMTIVFGYGCPYISGNDTKRLIPEDLLIRLKNAQTALINKIILALKKNNFDDKNIKDGVSETLNLNSTNIEVVDRNDLSRCIQEMHAKQKSLL